MRNKLFSYTFHSLVLIYFLRSYRTNLISLSHNNSPDSKTDISLFYIFSFPYHLRHFPFNTLTPRIKCNVPREVLPVSRAHKHFYSKWHTLSRKNSLWSFCYSSDTIDSYWIYCWLYPSGLPMLLQGCFFPIFYLRSWTFEYRGRTKYISFYTIYF